MKLKRLYYRLTTKPPTKELEYSVEDFSKGMRWAKSLQHPTIESLSLYDYFHRWDSTEVLSYLNQKIRENNTNDKLH
jgi:hypothetical protein